jgi:hypothetical protein
VGVRRLRTRQEALSSHLRAIMEGVDYDLYGRQADVEAEVCVNLTQVCVNLTQACVNLTQACVNLRRTSWRMRWWRRLTASRRTLRPSR